MFYVQVPVYHYAEDHTPSLPWYEVKWKTLGALQAATPEDALLAAKKEFPNVPNPVISSRNDGICAASGSVPRTAGRRSGGSQLRRQPRAIH